MWVVTAALWAGCLLPGPPWLLLAGCLLVVAAWRRPRRHWARLLVVAVGIAAVGSGAAGVRVAMLSRGPLVELATRGGSGEVAATVVSDVHQTEHGGWFLASVGRLDGVALRQRAAVRLPPGVEGPALGSTVRFTTSARPLETTGFDSHLRRLHAATFLDPVLPLQIVRGPPALIAVTNGVRVRVRAATARSLSGDCAALLAGLVVGDTTGLSEQAADELLGAGLSHLVAVSGSNVALVLAGAVALSAMAGFGARGRRRIAVAAVLWFVVLVRGEPSVLRAAAMALLVLGANASGRGSDPRHALGAAALVLLLVDPFLAGQLGFVLSVLATGGVVVIGPALARRIPGPTRVATLLGATAGAQLGVAPVLLTMDAGLPLAALPANLIAVPAAAVASALGIVAALCAQLSAGLGGAVAWLAAPMLAVILWAGRTFAHGVALHADVFLTPAFAALALALVFRRRSPRLSVATVGAVLVVAVGAPLAPAPTVQSLTLTALDVGQGDAILIEVPAQDGQPPARMLVDGGPEDTVASGLLRRRHIRYLDAVVVSHPHADHTDGLPAVLARIRTGVLLVGPTPATQLHDPAASATATEVVAAQHGVPIQRVSAGQQFNLGGALVQVLSPPADGSLGDEPNDNSVVLRVTTEQGSVLLTGDIEEAAQTRLLQRPDLLRADILKVPHHGGDTNADGFFDAVGATTAVIGVGADNDYGHPAPEVLGDLAGGRVLRTDITGTITVAVE